MASFGTISTHGCFTVWPMLRMPTHNPAQAGFFFVWPHRNAEQSDAQAARRPSGPTR